MDIRDIPKPERIAALTCDERGYPIFYSIQPPEGRTLNFRALNYDHVLRCGTRRLCGICEQALDYRLWFVGSREDVDDRLFVEPPMHRACLDYALLVCPFFAGRYAPKHRDLGPAYVRSDLVETARLDEIALYCTRAFTVVAQRIQPVFKAAPATSIEWRAMEAPA